jgi:hypothetical protein
MGVYSAIHIPPLSLTKRIPVTPTVCNLTHFSYNATEHCEAAEEIPQHFSRYPQNIITVLIYTMAGANRASPPPPPIGILKKKIKLKRR